MTADVPSASNSSGEVDSSHQLECPFASNITQPPAASRRRRRKSKSSSSSSGGVVCQDRRCCVWLDLHNWFGYIKLSLPEDQFKSCFTDVAHGGVGFYEKLIVLGGKTLELFAEIHFYEKYDKEKIHVPGDLWKKVRPQVIGIAWAQKRVERILNCHGLFVFGKAYLAIAQKLPSRQAVVKYVKACVGFACQSQDTESIYKWMAILIEHILWIQQPQTEELLDDNKILQDLQEYFGYEHDNLLPRIRECLTGTPIPLRADAPTGRELLRLHATDYFNELAKETGVEPRRQPAWVEEETKHFMDGSSIATFAFIYVTLTPYIATLETESLPTAEHYMAMFESLVAACWILSTDEKARIWMTALIQRLRQLQLAIHLSGLEETKSYVIGGENDKPELPPPGIEISKFSNSANSLLSRFRLWNVDPNRPPDKKASAPPPAPLPAPPKYPPWPPCCYPPSPPTRTLRLLNSKTGNEFEMVPIGPVMPQNGTMRTPQASPSHQSRSGTNSPHYHTVRKVLSQNSQDLSKDSSVKFKICYDIEKHPTTSSMHPGSEDTQNNSFPLSSSPPQHVSRSTVEVAVDGAKLESIEPSVHRSPPFGPSSNSPSSNAAVAGQGGDFRAVFRPTKAKDRGNENEVIELNFKRNASDNTPTLYVSGGEGARIVSCPNSTNFQKFPQQNMEYPRRQSPLSKSAPQSKFKPSNFLCACCSSVPATAAQPYYGQGQRGFECHIPPRVAGEKDELEDNYSVGYSEGLDRRNRGGQDIHEFRKNRYRRGEEGRGSYVDMKDLRFMGHENIGGARRPYLNDRWRRFHGYGERRDSGTSSYGDRRSSGGISQTDRWGRGMGYGGRFGERRMSNYENIGRGYPRYDGRGSRRYSLYEGGRRRELSGAGLTPASPVLRPGRSPVVTGDPRFSPPNLRGHADPRPLPYCPRNGTPRRFYRSSDSADSARQYYCVRCPERSFRGRDSEEGSAYPEASCTDACPNTACYAGAIGKDTPPRSQSCCARSGGRESQQESPPLRVFGRRGRSPKPTKSLAAVSSGLNYMCGPSASNSNDFVTIDDDEVIYDITSSPSSSLVHTPPPHQGMNYRAASGGKMRKGGGYSRPQSVLTVQDFRRARE